MIRSARSAPRSGSPAGPLMGITCPGETALPSGPIDRHPRFRVRSGEARFARSRPATIPASRAVRVVVVVRPVGDDRIRRQIRRRGRDPRHAHAPSVRSGCGNRGRLLVTFWGNSWQIHRSALRADWQAAIDFLAAAMGIGRFSLRVRDGIRFAENRLARMAPRLSSRATPMIAIISPTIGGIGAVPLADASAISSRAASYNPSRSAQGGRDATDASPASGPAAGGIASGIGFRARPAMCLRYRSRPIRRKTTLR